VLAKDAFVALFVHLAFLLLLILHPASLILLLPSPLIYSHLLEAFFLLKSLLRGRVVSIQVSIVIKVVVILIKVLSSFYVFSWPLVAFGDLRLVLEEAPP